MKINDILKLQLPHTVVSSKCLRLRRSQLRDFEIREILHQRLIASGFKRNPVLSDCYACVYECVKMRVMLTHYARETVAELEMISETIPAKN